MNDLPARRREVVLDVARRQTRHTRAILSIAVTVVVFLSLPRLLLLTPLRGFIDMDTIPKNAVTIPFAVFVYWVLPISIGLLFSWLASNWITSQRISRLPTLFPCPHCFYSLDPTRETSPCPECGKGFDQEVEG